MATFPSSSNRSAAASAPSITRPQPTNCLAGRDGLRGDETNYWIFSETGLRTLVDRAGWEVCDWLVAGDEGSACPGTQPDERVFCLLRSRAYTPAPVTQLVAR